MDNVTHSLVGLAAAKAGLERVSPYATAVCIIAANAPDADLLGLLGGRWYNLQHHRGITHSIVGVIALGLLLPTIFYWFDRWRARRRGVPPGARWGALAGVSLLLTASHPFLDWMNNYGVRPFLPWDGHWIYGDLLFVAEPVFWLVLGLTCFWLTAHSRRRVAVWAVWGGLALAILIVAPWVREVALPRVWPFLWGGGLVAAWWGRRAGVGLRRGARLAQVALLILAVYTGLAWALHRRALAAAEAQMRDIAAAQGETPGRFAAMPWPGNPVRWLCLAETDKATYRYEVSVTGALPRPPQRYAKLTGTGAEWQQQVAERDERVRIWRDFARFPAAQVTGDCVTGMFMQFADLRFAEPGRGRNGSFALSVEMDCDGK